MGSETQSSNKILLYSYSKVWNGEYKIYAIDKMKLPVAIKLAELFYFIGSIILILLLAKLFPFVNDIPVVLKFLLIPYGLTKLMGKMKLDGKTPPKFFYGLIIYLAGKGKIIERFHENHVKRVESYKVGWDCSRGRRKGGNVVAVSD